MRSQPFCRRNIEVPAMISKVIYGGDHGEGMATHGDHRPTAILALLVQKMMEEKPQPLVSGRKRLGNNCRGTEIWEDPSTVGAPATTFSANSNDDYEEVSYATLLYVGHRGAAMISKVIYGGDHGRRKATQGIKATAILALCAKDDGENLKLFSDLEEVMMPRLRLGLGFRLGL
nr:hypothetical protein Iba_chr07aCG6900 [Ipomoea batatas]